ncbi:MAG: sensor histidine kinase, partial [Saprospiraceae bacterium]|nr:sensor histidine kinase [Saprospiraceae bacterium]
FHALEQLIKSIKQTMMFADEIGRMNLDADYQLLGKGDRLGRSLIAMREKLKIMKLQEEQLQLMTQKSLLQGQERERERLSRDMHDGLGPLLTSLKMMIQRIRMIPEEKEKIKQTLDETISEVRRMTYNLMPQALVDFGVGAALENLVKMTSKASGLNIRYANSMKESRLPDTVNIGLYRIAQEALNNSLKHSGASEIKMSLTEFDDRISFYFEDNGQGFDVTKSYPGSGLLNIKERCRVLNGILHMESNQDGTVLEIEIPLEL